MRIGDGLLVGGHVLARWLVAQGDGLDLDRRHAAACQCRFQSGHARLESGCARAQAYRAVLCGVVDGGQRLDVAGGVERHVVGAAQVSVEARAGAQWIALERAQAVHHWRARNDCCGVGNGLVQQITDVRGAGDVGRAWPERHLHR